MMRKRLSVIMRGSSSSSAQEDFTSYDNESKTTFTTAVGGDDKDDSLPSPSTKIKRVDNYYSRWSKTWKYRNTSSKVVVEAPPVLGSGSGNDQWRDCSFVVVRTIPRNDLQETTYRIVIKSDYLLRACREIIVSWPGISWNADPLELDPQIFITFHQKFLDYEASLVEKKARTQLETNVLTTIKLLNNTIAFDYRTTLANIQRLTKHGEMTFDLLYTLLVPGELFVARCAVTGLPRLLKLTSAQRTYVDTKAVYQLVLESVDLIDRSMSNTVTIGNVQTVIYLPKFKGTTKITELDVYPLKYHHDEAGLRANILARGKKWLSLMGVHHQQYEGIAAFKCAGKLVKHNVRSRIMIDRATFRRINAGYVFPNPVPPKANVPDMTNPRNQVYDEFGNYANQPPPPMVATGGDVVQQSSVADAPDRANLTEEEFLLTPAAVYGFSLADKAWLEFNIELVKDVEWNSEAFSNLVLPQGRKDLLQSLVESHHRELGFDDFIRGKGHGLVVNLYGPPGVGKTFSAEATSEHVQRPLYVIGGGDLGTTAQELDTALERVFDVATAWKAIVLIDEADVFLEQRSLHELDRNAMVAVFLRHVEYYRGILFLTTNRVSTFDEAFLSRIHVALHFDHLSQESKEQVWAAFIKKAGAADSITPEQVRELAKRDINGRQIKNAVRTAHSLAAGRGSEISFEHIIETLDAMAEFTRLFKISRTQ
ncbi:P-loop containing nucleoside triphosphate hydrolase protein [Coprinopsis marcescibilis]|uniref:P-loop containing nucleoside triphosphate hydrolase protein n=1 Tax=Coprinopsis marcescibilis TaxID=230819 RepID=A0A5C3L6A5_COPMA|nr:P-loop containing nucleoside triphosphate hydrolase protein [Coprinopsis marcescibilis]